MAEPWPFSWGPPARQTSLWERPHLTQPRMHFSMDLDADGMRAAFIRIGEAVARVWAQYAEVLDATHRDLVALGLVVDHYAAEEEDPRVRALRLRRTRNTGPPPPPLGRR